MVALYRGISFYIRGSRRIKSLIVMIIPCIICILIAGPLVTQTFGDNLDWQLVQEINIKDSPIDITISPEGSHLFILTANSIIVYSRRENKIINRIPVNKVFNKISFSKSTNEFILTGTASKSISIIKVIPTYSINIDGMPFKGPSNAPVSVVVFEDYLCSNCAILENIMKDVIKTYPEEIKLVIKHFPSVNNKLSKKLAVAALAANAQGKFWEYHRALFEKQQSLNDDAIQSIAANLSLDMTKFNQDLQSKAIKAIVDRDIEDAHKLRINGTPVVFINGKYLEVRNFQGIVEMINAELDKTS